MARGLGPAVLMLFLAATACGGSGLEPDHAPAFAGTWYGLAHETDTTSDGTTASAVVPARVQILVHERNAVRIPGFCNGADPGPVGTVVSPTSFTLGSHQCSPATSQCTTVTSLESGSGTLNGGTLTLVFRGTSRRLASTGCPADLVRFEVTLAATQDPENARFPVQTPTGLKVEPYFGFGYFRFSWDPPTDGSRITELQVQVDGGPWRTVSLYDGGATDLAGLIPPLEERTPLAFRVRASDGPRVSEWSEPVTTNSGFRQPEILTSTVLNGFIEIFFRARADVDALVVRRGDSADGPWTEIAAVNPTSGRFVDTSAEEGGSYFYLLQWRAGAIDGRSSIVNSLAAPLRPPTNLIALPTGDLVDLSWSNQTSRATEIAVLRADAASDAIPNQAVALLSPLATSFTDTSVPPGPHTYRVEARAPQVTAGGRNVVVITPPPASSGGWTADVRVVGSLPTQVLLDSQGRLASSSIYFGLVERSDHPSWSPHPLQGSLLLDPADRIHNVQARLLTPGGSTYAIVHEWLEAESWHTEEMTRFEGLNVLTFDLDPSGHPVAALSTGNPQAIRIVRWTGAGYQAIDVSLALPSGIFMESLWVGVGPDGVIHVIGQSTTTAYGRFDGSWSSEAVDLPPGSSFRRNDPTLVGLLPEPEAGLTLVTVRFADGQVARVRRDPSSGWAAAVPVLTVTDFGLLLARSADGNHTAILGGTDEGPTIVRSSDGWTPALLAKMRIGGVGLQYDASNRLVVILGVGATFPENLARVAIYREQ